MKLEPQQLGPERKTPIKTGLETVNDFLSRRVVATIRKYGFECLRYDSVVLLMDNDNCLLRVRAEVDSSFAVNVRALRPEQTGDSFRWTAMFDVSISIGDNGLVSALNALDQCLISMFGPLKLLASSVESY